MGKLITCCGIRMKFRLRVNLKPSNYQDEFEFDSARCHKNIVENSFSLGHGANSSLQLAWLNDIYSCSLYSYSLLRQTLFDLLTQVNINRSQ